MMPPLQQGWRRLRRGLPAFVKGAVRRQSDLLLPNREVREYRNWLRKREQQTKERYHEPPMPGLLSILTPVWDGSPVPFLKRLARTIIEQNEGGACEWVILDNGCSKPYLLRCLQDLARYEWVKLIPLPANIGITRGLRQCLERARGRYVLAVDADDYLHANALRIVASFIVSARYPPLLYSDEDKVIGPALSHPRFYQPYLKPDWDPVLVLNSAYIAHLGIADRAKALELGAYSDPETEASPDWDLFVRFMVAGYWATHIPEVLYGWRVHASSTADDAASKPQVDASQQAVLQSFLNATGHACKFRVERSPLFGAAPHWMLVRKQDGVAAARASVVLDESDARADALSLMSLAEELSETDGFLHLAGQDVEIENPGWLHEILGITDLHLDTVMVGGRIWNTAGRITGAGRYFGFGGVCGDPNRGRAVDDPGYFAQMWKQRSVSAVSTQVAVIRARFLVDVLRNTPKDATVAFLGTWAGAHAIRTGKRIVYSPFIGGCSDLDWDTLVGPEEKNLFARLNADLIPDRRFYSRNLSLTKPFGLSEVM
jgi:hypothetical protein